MDAMAVIPGREPRMFGMGMGMAGFAIGATLRLAPFLRMFTP